VIEALYQHAYIVYGSWDDDLGQPEPAIGVSVDVGGVVILQQEDRSINIQPRDVAELCKALRAVVKAATE
jgi:hypothetical protein